MIAYEYLVVTLILAYGHLNKILPVNAFFPLPASVKGASFGPERNRAHSGLTGHIAPLNERDGGRICYATPGLIVCGGRFPMLACFTVVQFKLLFSQGDFARNKSWRVVNGKCRVFRFVFYNRTRRHFPQLSV